MSARIRELLTLCLIALPVWGLLRGGWLLGRRRRPRLWREAVMAVFAVFMAALLCMALEGRWQSPGAMLSSALERLRTGRKIHPAPFQVIGRQLRMLEDSESVAVLLGNMLLFMPWGFCLPLLWPRFRPALRMAGMALLLTCCIEGIQLFIDRFVETDDVLLNFLGAMGGYGMWRLLHGAFPAMDGRLLDNWES